MATAMVMFEESLGDLLGDANSPPQLDGANKALLHDAAPTASMTAPAQDLQPPPPSSPETSSSLTHYLLQHGLVGAFDAMLGECSAATATSPAAAATSIAGGNRVCDAMLRVVGEAMFARCALGVKECVPPDALNPSISGATVAALRHRFSGKRILVLVELPEVVPQFSQGPNHVDEVGPSVLATYRLELICKTIVAIVTLGMGVAAGANPGSPKVVLGFILTNLTDAAGGDDSTFAGGGGRKTKMPNASVLDGDSDDMDYDVMDAIMDDCEDAVGTARDDGNGDARQGHRGSMAMEDADGSFSGGVGGASTSGSGSSGSCPTPGSALSMLAAMLQGEGLEVSFLPSHTSLLQYPSSSSALASASAGGAPSPSADDLSDNGTATSILQPPPLSVSILPGVWAASAVSSNPLSVFDPILAFADAIVIEGLETLRLGHHPLFTYVPQSVGSAVLGIGAALEASAMRALLTGGSPGHTKLEFPGPSPPPAAGRAAAALRATTASGGKEGSMPSGSMRLLIVGDDETLCPSINTNLPLSYPTALVHLVAAAEALIYAFDTILLVGSAAMVLHRVQVRRRVAAAEEGEGAYKIDWATPTEAAVGALLDAVDQYSGSIPGGCQIIGAEDFMFVKKTTSGKSKVEVITAKTWNENEVFTAERRAPQRFYYTDVGPTTRETMLTVARTAATIVGFGALTRSSHHVGGSRAAQMPYSSASDVDSVLGATASSALIAQCRAQQTPLIVLGEQWAQAVACEAGAVLPFGGGYHYTPQPTVQLPVALQSRSGGSGGGGGGARSPSPATQRNLPLGDASGTTATAAARGLSRSVSDVHAHRRRQSSRSPDDRSLSTAAQNHLPRRVASSCTTYFLSKRLRKDRGPLQDECVHLSTTPYREAGRILAGDCWEALSVLPCAVPTRTGGGGGGGGAASR